MSGIIQIKHTDAYKIRNLSRIHMNITYTILHEKYLHFLNIFFQIQTSQNINTSAYSFSGSFSTKSLSPLFYRTWFFQAIKSMMFSFLFYFRIISLTDPTPSKFLIQIRESFAFIKTRYVLFILWKTNCPDPREVWSDSFFTK